jgi:transposase
MRHVRDVIRLKSAGMPTREIARRVGTAPSTVRLTIRRFEASGLTWPLPDDVTDAVLEARLFASAGAGSGTRRGHRRQAEPDWAAVHRELKRKHVTLSILWEEYIASEPDGYRYSRFCELYRAWEGRLSVTMRQSHAAGDKLFVDYAGDGVPVVIDRRTGERRAGSSSRCSAHPASPTRRRPGRRGLPTGSAATSVSSRRSAACRRCWCRTIPRSW